MSQIAAAPAVGRGMKEVRRWRAFALLAVAYFMTVADLAIVNVALPTIGRKLHFAESDLQWVVPRTRSRSAASCCSAAGPPTCSGAGASSWPAWPCSPRPRSAAGWRPTEGFLIAMRGVQGLGAAIVLPAALSIVMNMFAEGAERNKALGAWGAIGASGATVGVLAGGAAHPLRRAGSTSSSSTSRSARPRWRSPAGSCRKAGSPRRSGASTRSARSP